MLVGRERSSARPRALGEGLFGSPFRWFEKAKWLIGVRSRVKWR